MFQFPKGRVVWNIPWNNKARVSGPNDFQRQQGPLSSPNLRKSKEKVPFPLNLGQMTTSKAQFQDKAKISWT